MSRPAGREPKMGKAAIMDIEHLIECVRRHTFLYDLSHKDYKNVSLKSSTWESIGREVNQTGEAAKKKWKSLRDGYTKYKKEIKATTGSSRKNITYVWSSQLSFLDNYNVTRPVDLNVIEATPTSPVRIKTPSHDSSSSWSNPSTPSSAPLKMSPPASPEYVLSTFIKDNCSTSNAPVASSHSAATRSNKRKEIDDVNNTIHLSNNKKKDGHDGIDYLFLSYADTFKKFPLREQALLKLELAKLFTNTELRLLNNSDDSKSQHT